MNPSPRSILIVSQWYSPEPIAPIPELAEGLVALGYNVVVLTGFPNWPSGNLYPGYKLAIWRREIINGISIVRVPLYPNHSRNAARRSWNFLSFGVAAMILGALLVKRPDVVYGVHPPITAGFAAAVLAGLWRRKFVMEVLDLWPETLEATGMIRNQRALGLLSHFCEWVYSRASAIRVVSDGFRENLVNKGVPPTKIRVIPNWVDPQVYRPVLPDATLQSSLGRWEDGFTLMYAGAIGLAQGLDVMLDAAESQRHNLKLRFVVVGDGVDCERLKRRCEERALNSVHFVDRVPKERMPAILAVADALLVHLRPMPLFSITVPHKIYAYMAVGKPVLAALAGEAARLISSKGAGVVCSPGDPVALAAAIESMQAMPQSSLKEMGSRGREVACTRFHSAILIRNVASMIESCFQRDIQNSVPERI